MSRQGLFDEADNVLRFASWQKKGYLKKGLNKVFCTDGHERKCNERVVVYNSKSSTA